MAERQITGDDIITEILRNQELGLFRMRYTTLIPCIYRIYLHPDDYDLLRPAMPAVGAEAKRALEERRDELREQAKPSLLARHLGIGAKPEMEYRILDSDWTIEFHADAEDRLAKGEIEIFSELGSGERAEYGVGSMTQRITRRQADGAMSSTTRTVPAAAAPGDDAVPGFAVLRFTDNEGPQTFTMTKDQIVIGRGGKAYWVDVKLSTAPDVSREHCRLRRDPQSGRFYLKDVSQFGTTIDGKPVPSSLAAENGQERDKNIEVPLPDRARIGLAGIVFIEFQAART